jgi:hypothetical protein
MKEKDKRNSAGWHNEFISFRLQGPLTPELQETMKKRMELLYDLMINKYNFQLGFKDVEEDPWEMSAESSMGITSMEKGRNVVGQSKLYCFVSYGLVMPLLRDDLTDQEILGTQFFLANTLMHEIVVSGIICRDVAIGRLKIHLSMLYGEWNVEYRTLPDQIPTLPSRTSIEIL